MNTEVCFRAIRDLQARKKSHDKFNRDMIWKNLRERAKKLVIATDGVYQIDELWEKIDQAERKPTSHPHSTDSQQANHSE